LFKIRVVYTNKGLEKYSTLKYKIHTYKLKNYYDENILLLFLTVLSGKNQEYDSS